MGLDQEESLSRAVFSALRLFSPFLFPSSLSHSPSVSFPLCRTAASTFKDFGAGVSAAEARHGTAAAVSGLLRPDERTKDVLTKPRTKSLCEAGSDGADSGAWSGRPSRGESALEWAPKFQLQLFP